MPKPTLPKATITPRRSEDRKYTKGQGNWLRSYQTFSFDSNYDHKYTNFGSIMVLNEDLVAPRKGFATHHHQDAEIFSYVLKGQLTHRDSTVKKGDEEMGEEEKRGKRLFCRMKRGDVQFTTGGSGISHSEQNEKSKVVHFLQIWIRPWKDGLKPIYHTRTFNDSDKKEGFVLIISPLAAGPEATLADEEAAIPKVPETIPIHADFVMGASIIGAGSMFSWIVGGGSDIVSSKKKRNVYVHVAMTAGGKAKVRLDGREEAGELNEGDGAFVSGVNAGDMLTVESIGSVEAEVVVLDSN
ncbi:hypothetical protein ATEG_08296 [Paecilomyces variotii No. 5]|uniref:Pirin N-terminal domain-containing protein n=1 Tax=Byssochlamys spectabilis (strain No. 5 / NBRC 109023) TaxID=1356009 RepID=V5I1G7_BYSSN|nr:hypothetical protein ATEG_08296 [Paecilomyces variotii No. 5]